MEKSQDIDISTITHTSNSVEEGRHHEASNDRNGLESVKADEQNMIHSLTDSHSKTPESTLPFNLSDIMNVVTQYECKFCVMLFTDIEHLKEHVQLNHSSSVPNLKRIADDHINTVNPSRVVSEDSAKSSNETNLKKTANDAFEISTSATVPTTSEEPEKLKCGESQTVSDKSSAIIDNGHKVDDSGVVFNMPSSVIYPHQSTGVSQPSDLEKQVESTSSDADKQLYMCGTCGAAFPSIVNCRLHMISTHNVAEGELYETTGNLTLPPESTPDITLQKISVGTQTVKKKRGCKKPKIQEEEQNTPLYDDEGNEVVNQKGETAVFETTGKRRVRPPKSLGDYVFSARKRIAPPKITKTLVKYQKCSVRGCQAVFQTDQGVEIHESCHAENRDKTGDAFCCSVCKMKFTWWHLVRTHLWKKHEIDVELLHCDQCSFRCCNTRQLGTHMEMEHSVGHDSEEKPNTTGDKANITEKKADITEEKADSTEEKPDAFEKKANSTGCTNILTGPDLICSWAHNFSSMISSYEGHVDSLNATALLIQDFKLATHSRFIIKKTKRDYGKQLDMESFSGFIHWHDTQKARPPLKYDGIPFVIMGTRFLECCHGPDHEKNRRKKNVSEKPKKDDIHNYAQKKRRQIQISQKLECAARINIRHIVKFPEYKCLTEDKNHYHLMSTRLKLDMKKKNSNIVLVHQFHVELPSTHTNHSVTEADTSHKPYLGIYPDYSRTNLRKPTGENKFSCDSCFYVTADQYCLRRHRMRHTGHKPHKCALCPYMCIQAVQLKSHVKRKHPGNEHSCDKCSYQTVNKQSFLQHQEDHKNGLVQKTSNSNQTKKLVAKKPPVPVPVVEFSLVDPTDGQNNESAENGVAADMVMHLVW